MHVGSTGAEWSINMGGELHSNSVQFRKLFHANDYSSDNPSSANAGHNYHHATSFRIERPKNY
jgi:hypothetical protein